jgi:hypothetical protein
MIDKAPISATITQVAEEWAAIGRAKAIKPASTPRLPATSDQLAHRILLPLDRAQRDQP